MVLRCCAFDVCTGAQTCGLGSDMLMLLLLMLIPIQKAGLSVVCQSANYSVLSTLSIFYHLWCIMCLLMYPSIRSCRYYLRFLDYWPWNLLLLLPMAMIGAALFIPGFFDELVSPEEDEAIEKFATLAEHKAAMEAKAEKDAQAKAEEPKKDK